MKEFLAKIEKWTAQNIVLKVLRNAMLPVVPLVIIGSVFQIIVNLPTLLPFIPAFSEKLTAFLTLPYTVTNGMVGLVVAFSVGYYYSREKKINQLYGGIISAACFFIAANDIYSGSVVNTSFLGSGGMFAAIVVSFVAIKIMDFCKKNNISLKLPDVVPPAVSTSFDSIISGTIAITIIHLANFICVESLGTCLPGMFAVLLGPLFKASNSVWFLALCIGFVQLCWFLGLHGFNMISGILFPLLLGNLAENASALAAGGNGTAIGTFSFFLMAGHFLSVIPITVLILAKSEQLKAVGKLSVIPSIFNISEPYQFGLPIVGNIDLAIPNIIYLFVNVFIYYFATKIGFLGMTYVLPSTIIPHPIFDYIATNGDIRAIILWVIVFVIDFLIWAPFIKRYDNKLLAEEKAKSEKQNKESTTVVE